MDSNIIDLAALSPDDILIAVMGVTGAGKSTFISQVTGQEVGIGHGLISHTAAVGIYSHRISADQCVYLVDAPGFDDTACKDTEILKEVAFFFSQIYKNNVQLAGIIYLHRITDNQVSGTALKNLSTFKQLCGKDAFGHVVLCTSMWDNLDTGLPDIGEQREKELITRSEFWGAMHSGGSQVVRWLNTKESAQAVIDKIFKFHEHNGKAKLQIQQELVDKNLSLDETGAGQEVQREILAAKAELQEQIKQIRVDHKEMMRQSNETMAKQMAPQREAFETELSETIEAQEKLKISLECLMEQKTAEYEKLLATAMSEQQQLTEALKQNEVEYARARRQQLEDEESFQEAQDHFNSEVEALKGQIQDQGKELEEKKRLEKELQVAQELQVELEKQQLEEEHAAHLEQQEIEKRLEKKRKRKERMRDGLAVDVHKATGTILFSNITIMAESKAQGVYVALMGLTGAGKSTFINHCTKQEVEVGGTESVRVYSFDYRPGITINLVDTPGFDDTNRKDSDVLRDISAWLSKSYTEKVRLNGILYLHRISDPRMQGSGKMSINLLMRLCGKDALKSVVLTTTMWENVEADVGERREKELEDTEEFWGFMKRYGPQTRRH
ncbi:GTP binding domain protein [Fusarium austroafricanum]|uniref:GTP binding domain protein n=1 Tax=Fusarium austroafricanum TaxID=2364996 RepID=A0A8H4KIR2_9HYPO|nr:GTP binding domain protein [Fusarium austroafricanum]